MAYANSDNQNITGVLTLSSSGASTGSALTQHDVLVGGASNAIVSVSPSTAGLVLTSNGVSADPSFQSASASGAITTITGNSGGAESPLAGNFNILGTGSITTVGSANTETIQLTGLTNHSLLVGAGTATITNLGVATNGQLPIGSTGADPVLATLTQGTNITITNGAGTIQLDVASGAGLSLAAFGSTPNANGLTLSTGVLNMQPADGTFPGGVSTTTQNFAGAKVFNTSAASAAFLSISGGGGIATIQYPSSATSFNFNLPTTAGTSGFFLTSGGGGSTNMTWTNPASLPQGTVTSVSVVSANGFAGTVATATTTPAITLSTTITGVLSGNGTAITGSAVTQHAVLIGGATNAITSSAVGATGTVLAGNTGADPTFQSIATLGGITTITGNSGGAESPSAGNFNILGTGSITIAGTANTETVQLTGLTNHAIQVGAGTATLTQVGPTATAGQVLQSAGSSADPVFSTATYPATTTVNQILYSSATNVVGGISTAIDGVLITDHAAGVPSILANSGTPGWVLTAQSGAPPAWAAPATSGTVTTVSVVSANGFAGTVANASSTPAITLTTTITGVLSGNGTAITGSSVTQHGVVVAGASNALTTTAVGATGTVLIGNTGADPTYSATPAVTSITLSGGSALANYVAPTAWTPVLNFGGGTTGITYSTQSGLYSRIGNIVYFSCQVTLSNKGSSTGNAQITGLPLTISSSDVGIYIVDVQQITFVGLYVTAQLSNGNAIRFFNEKSASGTTVLDNTAFGNSSAVVFNGCYTI